MAFYRNRYSYEDAAPIIQKFKEFLGLNAKAVINEEDPDRIWYFYNAAKAGHREIFSKYSTYLQAGGFVKMAPCEDGIFIILSEKAEGATPTVSSSHVRLPKLSHLITLIPEDFFAVLRLIATAKNTQTKDSLALNPPAAGIQNLPTSTISQFFTLMRTNYRINADYADRKWTDREQIKRISTLEPTQLNQLYAMQYLTALQNPDLLYFPLETRVELELEWEQINDDYCVPPQSKFIQ